MHDNWIINDNTVYKKCKELAVFNDLDFIYAIADPDVFFKQAESMNMSYKELYDFWMKDEKISNRPFCCDYTNNLFYECSQNLRELLECEIL